MTAHFSRVDWQLAGGGADGSPFFWLGGTAWLLFSRLDRGDTLRNLDDRQAKGFSVIQVSVPLRRLSGVDQQRAVGGALVLVEAAPQLARVTGGAWGT